MKILETERLLLRPFEETDLDDLYEYAKGPHIGPNAGWEPHKSKEVSQTILKKFIEEDEVWAIVYKEDNKVIGSLGLHKDSLRSAEDLKMLGYVLSEDYWGKGIMTEAVKATIRYAFENLDIKLITIHHYPFNSRSKRVIEKSGFLYEGTLRHATKLYDGSVYDLVCYSMTREEWGKNPMYQ
jgi:[ribosomal protein S5]-alanine N-acetyltransferase